MIAVHVTHEAVEKMGGIGAVIAGLTTVPAYRKAFERTVLVGPLLATDRPAAERLGPGGKILYSSLDGVDTDGWAAKFRPIEKTYQVGFVYGVRKLADGGGQAPVDVEALLVDVFRCNRDRLNLFKAELSAKFDIASDRFEHIWEFEQYVRLAEPAVEAMRAIGCTGRPDDPVVVFAHEYMGVPTALKAILDGRSDVRTVFYAHEVAPARQLVETHDGHDLMFHNVLAAGEAAGRSMGDCFPAIRDFFKHAVVKAAGHCDGTFAVGKQVAKELRFLDPAQASSPVEVVFNGIASGPLTPARRAAHRRRMIQYAQNLFGIRCDHVFTHVARPVLSKGIWRDLRVCHELEPVLKAAGKTAALFMLGTLAGQRRTRDILYMERTYGWPVTHRTGYPDACNGEESLAALFEDFNRHHEAVRVVLVNQFGWQQRLCGHRMPSEMTFADLRRGTDVEFGMSVYEPFGISQFEPLSYGAICVVSNVCGCVDFARRAAGGDLPDNVLVADFTKPPAADAHRPAQDLTRVQRDAVESVEGARVAAELARRLPTDEQAAAALLGSGYDLARRLDWRCVVEDQFLPAIRRACVLDNLEAEHAADPARGTAEAPRR